MRQKKHMRRSKLGRLFSAGSIFKSMMCKPKRRRARKTFRSIDLKLAEKPLITGSQRDVARTIRELRDTRDEPFLWMENYERAKDQIAALERDKKHVGYHQPTENAINALKYAIGEAEIIGMKNNMADEYLRKYGSADLDPRLIRELTFQATKRKKFGQDVRLGTKPHQLRSGSKPSPLRLREWD